MANSAEALAQLQDFQSKAQTPDQMLKGAESSLGVQGAQQQVNGLRSAITNTTNLLNQVAPSVMGRTANSLVTNAQATRQIGNEQAPIQQDLEKNTGAYNDAQTAYKDLEDKALQQTDLGLKGQANQLSYLQGLYNNIYQQEQDAAKEAESRRQFDATLAESRASRAASGSGGASPSFGADASTGGSQMQQRPGGGFNFQGPNGLAISATAYSQAKGVPIRTLLGQMAGAGDAGAKAALDYVGNDYGINRSKLSGLKGATQTKTVGLLRALGFGI